MKLMYFLKHKEINYATLFSNKPISPFQVPFVLSPIELSGEFIKMYLYKIYYILNLSFIQVLICILYI